jgi:hypothetical protein
MGYGWIIVFHDEIQFFSNQNPIDCSKRPSGACCAARCAGDEVATES